MTDSIFLVGFMGSGKSEVGRELARRLNWSFVDLDEEISRSAGCSIPDIFAGEGERGFRKREREALIRYLPATRTVVSCGGGIVTQPENVSDLQTNPGTVCLQVSSEEAWKRVGGDANRPLVSGDQPEQRLRDLMAERQPLYASFPLQVSTDGFRSSEVVDQVLSELRNL